MLEDISMGARVITTRTEHRYLSVCTSVIMCLFLFIKILLVAGGWDVGRSTRLASTEIFDSGSWRQTGELSHPANGVRGARLGNTVFMMGELSGC